MINTDNEKTNLENKEVLVDQISAKLKDQGIKHDRAQIEKFLDLIKDEALSPASTPEEKKAKLKKLTESFYQVGYIGYYTVTNGEKATTALTLGLKAGTVNTLNA